MKASMACAGNIGKARWSTSQDCPDKASSSSQAAMVVTPEPRQPASRRRLGPAWSGADASWPADRSRERRGCARTRRRRHPASSQCWMRCSWPTDCSSSGTASQASADPPALEPSRRARAAGISRAQRNPGGCGVMGRWVSGWPDGPACRTRWLAVLWLRIVHQARDDSWLRVHQIVQTNVPRRGLNCACAPASLATWRPGDPATWRPGASELKTCAAPQFLGQPVVKAERIILKHLPTPSSSMASVP